MYNVRFVSSLSAVLCTHLLAFSASFYRVSLWSINTRKPTYIIDTCIQHWFQIWLSAISVVHTKHNDDLAFKSLTPIKKNIADVSIAKQPIKLIQGTGI